ncbi:MAG TPA: glycosyltransferase family 39 protein [Solirubrobacteraceae bacterium]|nr:glycosyltransferase family 39 protein [Solirubrobacteraceae bacterium]
MLARSSHTKPILLLVVLVGLGLRLTYIATTGESSFTQTRDGEIAHNIVAHGRWFVYDEKARFYLDAATGRLHRNLQPSEIDYAQLDRGAVFHPESGESIGSATLLAGLWQITGGESYLPLQVLQAIVDALAALLVYHIAMCLFNVRRAAIVAAALYALYPPIAWLTIVPYNDIWAVDFTIAIVATYLQALQSVHRWRWLAVCGLVAGIGSYFRPNVLLIVPVLALATIAMTGWREALRKGACVTVIGALFLIPWTVRNYDDFHAFIPGTSSLWENMWNGLGELPNDVGASRGTHGVYEEVKAVAPQLRPESPAWDDYLKPWVVHAIEHQPLFYLESVAHRAAVATLWNHDTTWMHAGVAPLRGYEGGILAFVVNRPLDLLQYGLQPLVFVFAALALALTWRRWRREHLILVAAALSVLVPYVVVSMEARYVLPAEFVYLIWIGLGADLFLKRLRTRVRLRSTRAARPVMVSGTRAAPTSGDA